MSFTVVPLHNLELPADTQIEFGAGFILQPLPPWVREEPILKDLSRRDRESVFEAKFALVAEYKAAAIAEPIEPARGRSRDRFRKLKMTPPSWPASQFG